MGFDLNQRGGRLHSGEQTAKLAPTLRYFLSLIPDPNCIQVQYDVHINPDTVAVAGDLPCAFAGAGRGLAAWTEGGWVWESS